MHTFDGISKTHLCSEIVCIVEAGWAVFAMTVLRKVVTLGCARRTPSHKRAVT